MNRPALIFAIFGVCLATILLEISLTRVFSFKLVYYFTYVILGIALLGVGTGGVLVALLPQARRDAADRAIPWYCLMAAAGVLLSFVVVVVLPVNALDAVQALPKDQLDVFVWEGSKLTLLCFVIFLPFLAGGLAISTAFATNAEDIHRLYFFDLLGAGFGCLVAVPLLIAVTPPGSVLLAGVLFALSGLPMARRAAPRLVSPLIATAALLLVGVLFPAWLPDPVVDRAKTMGSPREVLFSRWSPVFRVDVLDFEWFGAPGEVRVISHDGMLGSLLRPFDGDASKLRGYDRNERAYPFRLFERPRVAIIGSAGGNEVLASLHFGASHVTAVELNPVTVSLLTDHFRDYTGRLADHERVTLVHAEGRSFLMSVDDVYDVIWFVTPDSYAAMNAASSGAYVLAESYLYTVEMLVEALEHLSPDGMIITQFGGELAIETAPTRTPRFLTTAREAFRRAGIPDFERHVMVSTYAAHPFTGSSVVLKRSPVTTQDIERFTETTRTIQGGQVRFAWTMPDDRHPITIAVRAAPAELEQWFAAYPYDVRPVTDDAPFFWHFVRFRSALTMTRPALIAGHESGIGERLQMLMLLIAGTLAAVFLFSPFLLRRRIWRDLPHKGLAAVYFAALGTGFMFLEISLIQRLTLFLGYPTYSLTVTLFAVLTSTGLGSLLSQRLGAPTGRMLALLALALAALVAFYAFGLTPLIQARVGAPLAYRVVLAVAVLTPLGLCLGIFMPLGLRTVSTMTRYGQEYVAWAWAINGFFSVLSSLFATMLSMIVGFAAVMWIALVIYLAGIAALWRIGTVPLEATA